jgi:ribonuclease HI
MANIKIKNEGDPCRKCGTGVIKKQVKRKEFKPNQYYYFEYCMSCPNCNAIYHVEEAKRYFTSNQKKLF